MIQTNISSLEGIEVTGHSLEILTVVGCTLTKIESSFGALVKLRKLCLQENKIAKIENLSKCNHLQQLWLFSNQISVIENLESNVALKDLNLADNHIKKVTGVSRLVNLQALDLSGNPINTLPCIDEIGELPLLEQVFFASPLFEPCPIAELPNYKAYVITTLTLPSLAVIDDERLTPEQLQNYKNEYVQLISLPCYNSIRSRRNRRMRWTFYVTSACRSWKRLERA